MPYQRCSPDLAPLPLCGRRRRLDKPQLLRPRGAVGEPSGRPRHVKVVVSRPGPGLRSTAVDISHRWATGRDPYRCPCEESSNGRPRGRSEGRAAGRDGRKGGASRGRTATGRAGDGSPPCSPLSTTTCRCSALRRSASRTGRASVFLGAVSAGLIALGFDSTRGAGPVGRVIFQVLALTPLVFPRAGRVRAVPGDRHR